MENPSPVNLTPSEEVRRNGWQAEARDKDGHLISMLSSNVSDTLIAEFVRESQEDGCTVTFWPARPNGEG